MNKLTFFSCYAVIVFSTQLKGNMVCPVGTDFCSTGRESDSAYRVLKYYHLE